MATITQPKAKSKPDQPKLSTVLNYCDELIYNITTKWNEITIPKKYRPLVFDACNELGRFKYTEDSNNTLICQNKENDRITKITAQALMEVGLQSNSKQLKLKLTVIKDLQDFLKSPAELLHSWI